MGDMKTPDFDDLLAAFDIPDMVDPKAAIESGHDDHEGQARQNASPDEELHVNCGPDVGVSVIVKNIRNHDGSEHLVSDKPIRVSVGNGLRNGFDSVPSNKKLQNCVNHTTGKSTFSQFSPISSADEYDDDDRIEVDDPSDQQNNPPTELSSKRAPHCTRSPDGSSGNGPYKREINGNCSHSRAENGNTNGIRNLQKPRKNTLEDQSRGAVKAQVVKEARDSSAPNLLNSSQVKTKSATKLSSCIAAIAALSQNKKSTDLITTEPPITKQDILRQAKESPKVMEKLSDQESALDPAKKSLLKQPESPCSITSENSSKGSPSSPAGSTQVIPKVRIKTIKTSTGQIKRTVTRVLPDIDSEGLKKGLDPASIVVSSLLSSPASDSVFSCSSSTALPTTVVATSAGSAIEVTKQMTIKPVATAFLPVSAVKTAGSQVINLKLANNTTVKATVIPAASVQSASSAILKAASAIQQQTVVVPASSLTNTKMVPKTVHLTNLNLLPQAASASELHQVLSKQQQQPLKHAMLPKKLSRVQVLASSQSSVVEAFNKVLSSINPVPVYVPNLSPPSSACISLPSRGYKCLECGDAFALEKSLTQHYDRRSVRIEVTCNHCAKNLIFYNKCSLLSHARGHKDKGVVMQCSHLILKPIPADQMILAPSLTSSANSAHRPSTGSQGKLETTVISAPSSAPVVAAMPLDEDPSKTSRANLKCLECNEVFQEEASLAMHFQQAAESSGQKTCTICQMLLPNQCSFASHQRIHQHKSPYICPECGAICRSVHFQSHVTKNCLHYTRRVGYRCVHCSVIFADVAALKSHIQSSHCEIFYKCPICPMAFKSAPGTHSHAYTQHPGVKIGEPRLIYKCSMCDTVFTQQILLYTHFDQHISTHKVSVFKCPDCSMHYAQKQLMLDHIKSSHGTLKSIDGPPNLGINLPLSNKPINSIPPNIKEAGSSNSHNKGEKKPVSPCDRSSSTCENPKPPTLSSSCPGWTCRDCERLFTQREVFIAHMKREHGKQLKKHPCRLCEKSFSSSHSLCRHNRIKHKGVRKVYTCPHCSDCKRTFTKRLLLEKHIQLMHNSKKTDRKPGPESVEESSVPDQVLGPKRKLNSEGEDAEEEEEDVTTQILGQEHAEYRGSLSQPVKKLKVSVIKTHRCAVCGFATTEPTLFQKHLPQHKTDGSSHQCSRCGLCYTSRHSLARHLFIVHKLKEVPGAGEPQEMIPDVPDTQCRVCSKSFDTEPALNTHMRTHGMAFIKSKRLCAAEK